MYCTMTTGAHMATKARALWLPGTKENWFNTNQKLIKWSWWTTYTYIMKNIKWRGESNIEIVVNSTGSISQCKFPLQDCMPVIKFCLIDLLPITWIRSGTLQRVLKEHTVWNEVFPPIIDIVYAEDGSRWPYHRLNLHYPGTLLSMIIDAPA